MREQNHLPSLKLAKYIKLFACSLLPWGLTRQNGTSRDLIFLFDKNRYVVSQKFFFITPSHIVIGCYDKGLSTTNKYASNFGVFTWTYVHTSLSMCHIADFFLPSPLFALAQYRLFREIFDRGKLESDSGIVLNTQTEIVASRMN